ncbi:MAG: type II toxin-antitoxin system VapC family toxin [Chloroflexi bacterium]|nr:type II toxin-antitoxin system VapC family toxin [Chloroflexota bacterium]
MVVLDTNVVSELMRASPTLEVVEWLDAQQTRDLFVTSVTEAEIRAGMAVLPEGARRRGLVAAAERVFGNLFAGRVLSFDSAAARAYAEIFATRQAAGRPLSLADGQIAAIARSRGKAVVTRNVGDFEGAGVELVDPWAAV